MAPLAAGHLQFQRFVSCASQFAQWVDDSMALRPARRTSSGAGAARVTSPAAFQSAATCCRSGKRNCQASVRAAQTRKSPARRIGTPIPGSRPIGKRPVYRFPIPDSRPIGNRESGNPPKKNRENGGSDSRFPSDVRASTAVNSDKAWVDIVRRVRPIVRHLRVRVVIIMILHRPVLGS
jgi:hypothetical protein